MVPFWKILVKSLNISEASIAKNSYTDRLRSACPTLMETSGTVLGAAENCTKTTEVSGLTGLCGITFLIVTTTLPWIISCWSSNNPLPYPVKQNTPSSEWVQQVGFQDEGLEQSVAFTARFLLITLLP
jgi:hypothetical protein